MLLKNRVNYPEKDKAVYDKLIALKQFSESVIILSYVSLDAEIDTKRFITYCFEQQKKIFVPKTHEHEIKFYEIKSLDDLETGNFSVLEPKTHCKSMDGGMLKGSFCLVPALACNAENHRIGYGKGYYDRFLKEYEGFSAAVCYKENILDFNADGNDIAVDIVVTD